jgi:hypothetical protein
LNQPIETVPIVAQKLMFGSDLPHPVGEISTGSRHIAAQDPNGRIVHPVEVFARRNGRFGRFAERNNLP